MDTYILDFQDYSYDYVILSGGRNSANTWASLSETLDRYIDVFRGANPNVKIFYSPEDMRVIQMLVDQYMEEKAYLNYNFTEVPQN